MGYEVTDIGGGDCVCFMAQSSSLFTTKFPFGFLFPKNFCITYIPEVRNVAYVFPSWGLCLDRTSDNCGS